MMGAGKEETLEKGVSHKLGAVLRMPTRHRAKGVGLLLLVYMVNSPPSRSPENRAVPDSALSSPNSRHFTQRIKEVIRTNIY